MQIFVVVPRHIFVLFVLTDAAFLAYPGKVSILGETAVEQSVSLVSLQELEASERSGLCPAPVMWKPCLWPTSRWQSSTAAASSITSSRCSPWQPGCTNIPAFGIQLAWWWWRFWSSTRSRRGQKWPPMPPSPCETSAAGRSSTTLPVTGTRNTMTRRFFSPDRWGASDGTQAVGLWKTLPQGF